MNKSKASTLRDKVELGDDDNAGKQVAEPTAPRDERGRLLPGAQLSRLTGGGRPKKLTALADQWFREVDGEHGRARAMAILGEIYERAMDRGDTGSPKFLTWLGDRVLPALKQREIEVEDVEGGTLVLQRDPNGNFRVPASAVPGLLGKAPWMPVAQQDTPAGESGDQSTKDGECELSQKDNDS